MDKQPRNLRQMLAYAKDLSEVMVDIAYAAIYFGDPKMGEEVSKLEREMSDLVQDMRKMCIMAVRDPREAEAMAAVLQVVSAIERIANDAVDIASIIVRRFDIPPGIRANLSSAREVSCRVRLGEESTMVNTPLATLELPVATGMRIMAVRRNTDWITDVDGEFVLSSRDVLILRGPPEGIDTMLEMAAASAWSPPVQPAHSEIADLNRAAEVLVEMKDLSEIAVGLAYSALVFDDLSLATEVHALESRLDDLNSELQLWVLKASSASGGGADGSASAGDIDPAMMRGLLMVATAAEDIGDQAKQMVWIVERDDDVHPIVRLALWDSNEVVVRLVVREGSAADGQTLRDLAWPVEPGFSVLAIRRQENYIYRPRGLAVLMAGDEIIAHGPEEGREALAGYLGWVYAMDEDTGEQELIPAMALGADTQAT